MYCAGLNLNKNDMHLEYFGKSWDIFMRCFEKLLVTSFKAFLQWLILIYFPPVDVISWKYQ